MIRKKLKSKVKMAAHAIPMATAACACIYVAVVINTAKSFLKIRTQPVDL